MKYELVLVVTDDGDNFKSQDRVNATSIISLLQQFIIVAQQITERHYKEELQRMIDLNDNIPF